MRQVGKRMGDAVVSSGSVTTIESRSIPIEVKYPPRTNITKFYARTFLRWYA